LRSASLQLAHRHRISLEKNSSKARGRHTPAEIAAELHNRKFATNVEFRFDAIPIVANDIHRTPRYNTYGQKVAQPKLRVSQPGDIYEQEADRIAEQVVHMQQSISSPKSMAVTTTVENGDGKNLQPKCSTCQNKKEQEEEKEMVTTIKRKAQAPSTNTNSSLEVSEEMAAQVANMSNAGRGAPLDLQTRDFMESRFGFDFGGVKIHTDGDADRLSSSLSAEAFTVGNHIYFSQGRYSPHSMSGRLLLAHELSHTLQQGASNTPAGGRQPSTIYRKVEVNNPSGTPGGAPASETNEKIVRDYVTTLCPDFTVTGGQVVPNDPSLCPPAVASESCGCLCEMHGLADTWTIDVNDSDWPHTDKATKTVTVHSPFSGVQFGAWTVSPARREEPNWLVLGHELCGHAKLIERGTHPTGPPPTHGGRPSHDVTVGIENTIATEHGIPATDLRGLFADPHHGESFAKVTVAQFPTNTSNVTSLPPAESRKLDIAEAFIKSAPVKMDVIGHADQTGPMSANTTISENRAKKVKSELVSRGISSARFLVTRGSGSSECTGSGDQPMCRKVDVFMYILEGGSESHP
jgi:outer membrane protein OmpA-like peptidoglycan-associated protein